MIALVPTLRDLIRAEEGAMAIETAIVAPILLVLSLGGVEAGSMVARQSELQSAAAEALNIVQAAPPSDQAARDTVRDIIKVSTGINDNDKVQVVRRFRCGTDADFIDDEDDCDPTDAVSTYVQITIQDTYEPKWSVFGLAFSDLDYNVVRTVQIS